MSGFGGKRVQKPSRQLEIGRADCKKGGVCREEEEQVVRREEGYLGTVLD